MLNPIWYRSEHADGWAVFAVLVITFVALVFVSWLIDRSSR